MIRNKYASRTQIFTKLLRIFFACKENPHRTFVAYDFNNCPDNKVYLELLIKMGLVEKVITVDKKNKNFVGFRLKKVKG